ncbi:hypothetical protein Mapa_000331 [Marchantia paleacea]|nr:hypothetical protein Mapa_000331 [Marchantia paleacea]
MNGAAMPPAADAAAAPARALEQEQEQNVGDENSPVEQVALTVPTTDDPTLPVWTFRMWVLGLASCMLLSFLNMFFAYRTEPFTISALTAQIVCLPLGNFLAAALPKKRVRVPFTKSSFSLNPGPFNIKEHVLITIFANTGYAFGGGTSYAVGIVTIIKAFYKREIGFLAGILIVITTQVSGYGWAGLMYKYLVLPAQMWWPASLVQVSLFRTLHEKEKERGLKRNQFFLIAMTVGFAYYVLPGYMFMMLTSMSWLCWAMPNSVLGQQLGSGLHGLGLGSFSLDWSGISSYLLSPLVTPWHAMANVMAGFVLVVYFIMPLTYWTNIYNAKTFPIFSSNLFTSDGQEYDVESIVNEKFFLDEDAYARSGPINMSTFFAVTYGLGFATITATVSHVALYHGKEIWRQSTRALSQERPDVHTRMMKRYPRLPNWWFLVLMAGSLALSIFTVEYYSYQLQLPWWGVIFACAVAAAFTLPIGIITATTNITPGLNIVTEYMMGYILPGKPIANVCFKTYGYISMLQAVNFTQDFKLGHYMKIPPRSMFVVQVVGTIVAGTTNMIVAWWLLTSIENICDVKNLPANSPWTCPSDRVFYDASVIWGLVGPKRIFGTLGQYNAMNWFWLFGFVAPVPFFILHKVFPEQSWIRLINMPLLLGSTALMPPASSVNYISWGTVGFIFNFYIFRNHKGWWRRYNYVLSAALDAGLAFMGVALYLFLQVEQKSMTWWGNNLDNCPLATCPTQPGIIVDGCPVF